MLNERTTSSIPPPAHAVGSAVICPGTRLARARARLPFRRFPFPSLRSLLVAWLVIDAGCGGNMKGEAVDGLSGD